MTDNGIQVSSTPAIKYGMQTMCGCRMYCGIALFRSSEFAIVVTFLSLTEGLWNKQA